MTPRPFRTRRCGFTLVELLCALAIIGLLAALLLPALTRARVNVLRIQCVSNLHQIGIGFHAFAHDHNGQFPMSVPAANGGTLELSRSVTRRDSAFTFAFRHFQAISNELIIAKVLVCPADIRLPALSFASLQNANVSYFVAAKASMARPNSLLAGDRNITNAWLALATRIRVGPGDFARWTGELHQYKGNLLFSDGHVEEGNPPNLLAAGSSRSEPVADLILPAISVAGATGATADMSKEPPRAGTPPIVASVEAPIHAAHPIDDATRTRSGPPNPSDLGRQPSSTPAQGWLDFQPDAGKANPTSNDVSSRMRSPRAKAKAPEAPGPPGAVIASADRNASESTSWALEVLLLLLLAIIVRLWIERQAKKRTRVRQVVRR